MKSYFPEWDLGMALEVLLKAPYVTIGKAPLKHLTYKLQDLRQSGI